MASKKKTLVRVSVYFVNQQMVSFELDPAKDKLVETAPALKIVRGDATKAVITINRKELCYHVVSQFVQEFDQTNRHPAFPSVDETQGIEFAGD